MKINKIIIAVGAGMLLSFATFAGVALEESTKHPVAYRIEHEPSSRPPLGMPISILFTATHVVPREPSSSP